MVPINYLAVLVAAIASMVIGSIWYGPLFGKQWMALMGITKESMSGAKVSMGKLYAIQALASVIMAFVLSHALVFASTYLKITGVSAGFQVGFWNWIGFIAPTTLASVLWEQKSWKLWLLNNAHYLVSLCIMGMILALWK